MQEIEIGKGRKLKEGKDIAVITLGPIGVQAEKAITHAEQETGKSIAHYDLRFLKPLDESMLHEIGKRLSKWSLLKRCAKRWNGQCHTGILWQTMSIIRNKTYRTTGSICPAWFSKRTISYLRHGRRRYLQSFDIILRETNNEIIIAGAGAVGTHLAKLLSDEKQDIILMDENEEKLKQT